MKHHHAYKGTQSCGLFLKLQAEAELKRLGQVYAVYAEHADNVRQYSQQLWADLDISRMVAGTDEVAKKLRGLTALKNLPVYELVEKEIQGFKNSLPMMRDLKNDALRKRHWDQLMAVTGAFLCMPCKSESALAFVTCHHAMIV